MQFDLSAVETGTMVFIGTLVFGLLIVSFMMTAGFVAMVLVGVGRLAWYIVAGMLLGLVHGINHLWDRLVHHASTVELPGEFPGQPSPSTGTYPRVALRDS
jgi:disulfide bond formation protein DsbB